MKKKYKTELEAMRDFYEELGITPDYSCNTDGRINGTLVEFKLNNSEGLPNIIDQLKRYIRSYNAVALRLPYFSLIININQRKYRLINNTTWKTTTKGKWKNPKDLLKFLNGNVDIKGWIDEFSIVSYNDLFYGNHTSAKKDDFIKEIKNPKELNIKPYSWDKTGDMERSILDCLGGKALKKRLGAFFTPDEYVKISTEYLRNAISRVPKGYDYIVLDRCAGTGNLEKFLTDEELSHCILNTYVYAEWTTLKGLYEGRARYIIPHTKDYKDPDGLLSDGDALTEKFNTQLTEIIEIERQKAKGKLVVIGLENPPYATPGAEATRSGKTYKQTSWVKEQMKLAKILKGDAGSDICNHFIYSATNILNVDEYIVYAPIKYWKSQHLFDGKFNEGYLCNRKGFHATEAAISLISWSNDKANNDQLEFQSDSGNVTVKKLYKGASTLLPDAQSRKVNNSFAGIILRNGTPMNLHGYLVNVILKYDEGRVREINNLNTLQLLPLWVANCYKPKDYTEKEVTMKSGDGGTTYQEDADFLNDCFVWSCLTNMNKCISNDQVKNELCLSQDTEADKLLVPSERNALLLEKWEDILTMARATNKHKPDLSYGLCQICKDINIQIETGDRRKDGSPIKAYKYEELNNLIKGFKKQLNAFYDEHITPKLFKYELLK